MRSHNRRGVCSRASAWTSQSHPTSRKGRRSTAITEKLKTTPPPLICLAALLVGLGLHAIWPLVSIPGHLRYSAGSLLIFGSLLCGRLRPDPAAAHAADHAVGKAGCGVKSPVLGA